MNKKRFIAIITAFLLMLSLIPSSFAGDPNISGGGGTIGAPTQADSVWSSPYPDGVRVSIVKVNPTTKAYVSTFGVVDYSYYSISVGYYFGKVNKLQYKNGASLNMILNSHTPYTKKTLSGLPRIIDTNSYPANITEIRDFFANANVFASVAKDMGETSDTAIKNMKDSGEYKLIIEPMVYITFEGKSYAFTATEAALFNAQRKAAGLSQLKTAVGKVTHQNLPFALFLERADLGISAYSGVTTGKQEDNLIVSTLGIGIVSFAHEHNEPALKLKYTLSAEPKNKTVAGPVGQSVTLGDDVIMTLKIESAVPLKDWKERICEQVQTVDLYFKFTSPDNLVITSWQGWKLGGEKNTISRDRLFTILESTAPFQYKFGDKVSDKVINENEAIRYDYTVEVWVVFKEHGTGGEIKVTGEKSGDYASFTRDSVAIPDNEETAPDPEPEVIVTPPERVAYKSEPQAWSELKQGRIGHEDFEAMAGTPTTRDLYFAVGGSEFIVDFEGLILKNNTAERTYHAHYDGTDCEFKEADNSKTHSLGGVTVNTHTGGSYSAAQSWSGNHSHSQNPTSCGTCGVSGYNACTLNTAAYNTALAAANTYASQINGTVLTWTAGSDGQTRTKSGWGASSSVTQNDTSSNAKAQSGGSGCLHGGCSIISTPESPHTHSGKNCSAGSACSSSHAWKIIVVFNVSAHILCGPCCEHVLPAVDDTWKQEITYDYLDFTKAVVWRLDGGRITGMETITGGVDELNAAILQGEPNVFYNIAETETSGDGRFRYTLEPEQHDAVTWNLGTRTNKCDKQDKAWGIGIVYTNTRYPHESGYLEANSTAKDKAAAEYTAFKEKRESLVQCTVISDFLILQTSSGDQPIFYYHKQTPAAVQSQQDFSPVTLTKAECWEGIPEQNASAYIQKGIHTGSYNGKFNTPDEKYKGSGTAKRVATVFDNDPAKTVTRPSRPSKPLHVALYNIDVPDTLPNGGYDTGKAYAVWNTVLDYDEAKPTLYDKPTIELHAPYSNTHVKVNGIVIHNPVSAEYAMVLSLDASRDQRTSETKGITAALRDELIYSKCPETAEECEFRELECHYAGTYYHTEACYSVADEKISNSHYHSVNCLKLSKVEEALQPVAAHTHTSGCYTSSNITTQYHTSNNGYPTTVAGSPQKLNAGGNTVSLNVTGSAANPVKFLLQLSAGCLTCTQYYNDLRLLINGSWYTVNSAISAGFIGSGITISNTAGAYTPHPNPQNILSGGNTGVCKWATLSFNFTLSKGTLTQVYVYAGYTTNQGDGIWLTSTSTGSVLNCSLSTDIVPGTHAGDAWGLTDLAQLGTADSFIVTDSWLAKQSDTALANIIECGNLPLNIHTCNASCGYHGQVLMCTEPHHYGSHYSLGSDLSWVCWDACNNDDNHAVKTADAPGSGISAGDFVNLDWGFQLYWPNTGDFWQGGAYGITALTTQRGKGFVNGMDTGEWIAKKRVMFEFDVIFCGGTNVKDINGASHGTGNHNHTSGCKYYEAETWIEVSIDYSYYNFYIPASETQRYAMEVMFEVTAINSPTGDNDNSSPANRLRDVSLNARHGAVKTALTDVVGRVGNLVMSDTGDWRFSNFFKNPVVPEEWLYGYENLVKKVDTSSKNNVLAELVDIRGLAIGSLGQDTYGRSPWLRDGLVPFILSPEKNNIKALRRDPLRAGYSMYMSVDTVGRDITTLAIVPYYYWFDPVTNTAAPLDVYMNGMVPVNLFGAYGSVSGFNLELKWQSEYKRRNVSDDDYDRTQSLSGVYPSGDYLKQGTAQMIVLDERSRTYVGSSLTMGKNQNLGGLSSVYFDTAVKRWHFTLGLPSSAFFVDAGADPGIEANRAKYEQMSGVILMTAGIYAYGDNGVTLEHSLSGSGTFTVSGVTYTTPDGIPPVIAVLHGTLSSRDDITITKTH